MAPAIGVITIGQTPRVDMIPAISGFFPQGTTIIEKGVLDGKSAEEIMDLAPEHGETTLVSRLRDGGSAVMAKEKILPVIQGLIDELNQEDVSLIILACTGKFPLFKSKIPIVYPDHLLNHVVKGLFHDGLVGVVVPLPEQAESIMYKWKSADFLAIPMASSPYSFQEDAFIKAIQQLDQFPIKAIILDCMGYTEKMKQMARLYTSKPVVLSRNMIYKTAGEIF
ncbi:AroM family protein [Neobacillus niacini]|uniref:AroM family protein n=1 Tax=Neobacillus niacini TaxID=86668 RepID=UPI0021CB0238|nr:AroM family protein [Neobacillus niacini]MCM3763807.1 AroM family protein [Neobacillus niacini]